MIYYTNSIALYVYKVNYTSCRHVLTARWSLPSPLKKAFFAPSFSGVSSREVKNTSDGITRPFRGDIPLELCRGPRAKHGVDSRE